MSDETRPDCPTDDFDDDEPEPRCHECDGDGVVFGDDLDDPLWYDADEVYACPCCGGSGLAKDSTYC